MSTIEVVQEVLGTITLEESRKTVEVVQEVLGTITFEETGRTVEVAQESLRIISVEGTGNTLEVVQPTVNVVAVAEQGPPGIQGAPGGPGPENLFVQVANPAMASAGLWIQTGLAPAGAGITFWVEDGA